MKNHEQKEKQFSRRGSIQVVIPAASDNKSQPKLAELLKDKPLCMLDIAGKAILQRQLDIFRSMGMSDIHVIGGYRHEKIKIPGVKVITNQDYSSSQSAYSIMCAQDRFGSKTLITYSDILFDRSIVERLIESPHTITIVIDRAYQSLPARDKKYDLVIAEDQNQNGQHRRLDVGRFKLVKTIGKNLDKSAANHEFIGMAFIQEDGILQLKKAWKDAQSQFVGKPFYEAISTHEASFTDVIQHLIDKGVAVYGLEIECGWSEIHSIDDYQRLTEHFQSPALIQN